jgi:hypothetical protein
MTFFSAFTAEIEKLAIKGEPLGRTLRGVPWRAGGKGPMADPLKYIEGAKTVNQLDARLRNLRMEARLGEAERLKGMRKGTSEFFAKMKARGMTPKQISQTPRMKRVRETVRRDVPGFRRMAKEEVQLAKALGAPKAFGEAVKKKRAELRVRAPKPKPGVSRKPPPPTGGAPARPGRFPTKAALAIGIPIAFAGAGGLAALLLRKKKDYREQWEEEALRTDRNAETKKVAMSLGEARALKYIVLKRAGRVRPREYEHRDESLSPSELIENVPSATFGRGRDDRSR